MQPYLSSTHSPCAILSSVPCLGLQYFTLHHTHYLIKGKIFRKKCTEHNICAQSPQIVSKIFLVLEKKKKRINRDIINVHASSCIVPVILVRCLLVVDLDLSREIFGKKSIQILNFMKNLPVGAELFDADRRRVTAPNVP